MRTRRHTEGRQRRRRKVYGAEDGRQTTRSEEEAGTDSPPRARRGRGPADSRISTSGLRSRETTLCVVEAPPSCVPLCRSGPPTSPAPTHLGPLADWTARSIKNRVCLQRYCVYSTGSAASHKSGLRKRARKERVWIGIDFGGKGVKVEFDRNVEERRLSTTESWHRCRNTTVKYEPGWRND